MSINYRMKTANRRAILAAQPHTHCLTLPHRYEGYAYREDGYWRLEMYGPQGDMAQYRRFDTFDELEEHALIVANNPHAEMA